MKRDTVILFLLATVLAVASFLFFSVFYGEDIPPFATNIAAALMGSLITVIITMILLNKQSEQQLKLLDAQAEVQTRQQWSEKVLQAKIELYGELLAQVKEVMVKETVSYVDQVEIQILNQRLSYYASEDVLRGFNEFATLFQEVAGDGEVTDDERERLVQTLGRLSLKIRRDLATEEDKQTFDESALTEVVESNIKSLQPSKIDEDTFLRNCSESDRAYLTTLLDCLKSSDVEYAMATKGFAIKDRRRKSGKGVLSVFPTNVSKPNFQIRTSVLSGEALQEVKSFLDERGTTIDTNKTPPATIMFSTAQLPVSDACELVSLLLKRKVRGPDNVATE